MRYRLFQLSFIIIAFVIIQPIDTKAQRTIKLGLGACREMALSKSELLKQSEYKYQQACLDSKIATSAFLPKIEGSATSTYIFPNMDMMGTNLSMRGMYMAGITITQPLYSGGKIMTGKKLSKLREAIAGEQRRMTVMDVLVEADNAYWTLVAVTQKVKMLESYEEQMDSLFMQIATAVKAGLRTDNELLRVEANRSNITYQLQKARNGKDLCRISLCRIIGIDADTNIELTDTTIHINEPRLLAKDMNERPEMHLLKHQLDITQKQIQMSKANMLPTVGLAAGYTYYGNIKLNSMTDAGNGTMIPHSQEFHDGFGSIMLSVKIPVFQWGSNLNKVKKAKIAFQNAQLELEKNYRLMALEVQSAINNVYDGYRLIQTAETGLEQAEENLRVTINKYNVSMALLTDLLEAQSQWEQAKSNLIEALTQYKIYETEYLRKTGKLNHIRSTEEDRQTIP